MAKRRAPERLAAAGARPTPSETLTRPADAPAMPITSGALIQQIARAIDGGVMRQVNKVIGQYNPHLVTIDRRLQMLTDPDVAFGVMILSSAVQGMQWSVESEDPDIAAFVEANLRRIWRTFSSAASMAIPVGFQAFQKVWAMEDVEIDRVDPETGDRVVKVYPGAWVISRMKQIDPRTVAFLVGEAEDDWVGIEQFAGPFGSGRAPRRVDRVNSALWPFFRHKSFGNPAGWSVLYQAYEPWWHKQAVTLFRNRYLERKGDPSIKAKAPSSMQINGKDVSGTDWMAEQVYGIKNNSVIVFPSDRWGSGEDKFALEYLADDKRGDQFENTLQALSVQVMRGLLIPDKAATSGDGVGSMAQAKVHDNVLAETLEAIQADFVGELVQPQVVDPLVLYNFGEYALRNSRTRIKAAGLSDEKRTTLKELLTAIMQAEQAEAGDRVKLVDRIDVAAIAEALEVPTVSGEELERLMEERRRTRASAGAERSDLDNGDGSDITQDEEERIADDLARRGATDADDVEGR